MELITYKTNIKSESAICKVAAQLNAVISPTNWQLDLDSPGHYLTIYSPGIVDAQQVRTAIRKAGYRAVPVENIFSNS